LEDLCLNQCLFALNTSQNTRFFSPQQTTTNHALFAHRREAERDAAAEPLLSSFLYASILAHDTFERALAFVLSNRLANAVMLPTQLFEIFHEVLIGEPDVREGALADVEACRERVSHAA
jgi:serine O-acetyltransferase